MKIILIVAVTIVIAVAGFFAYRALYSNNKSPNQNSTTVAESNNIEMKNSAFSPKTTKVKVGDTVIWINNDKVNHTVTADDGGFESDVLGLSKTFSNKFDEVGIIEYHCKIHPSMKGEIIVE